MISCKEASRLASEKLERPLGLRERLQLRLHLAYCAGCRQMDRQFAFLRDASRNWLDRRD